MMRPRYKAPGEKRPAMLRLLSDHIDAAGYLNLAYDRQHRTMWRAMDLGFVTKDYRLTDKGKEYVARESAKVQP